MLTAALNAQIVRWNNTPDCRNQAFWNNLKSHPQYENLIKRADEAVAAELTSPLPWYLECIKTGNRSNYERRHNELRKFGPLVVAYCTTKDAKYLSASNTSISTSYRISLPGDPGRLICYYFRLTTVAKANTGHSYSSPVALT